MLGVVCHIERTVLAYLENRVLREILTWETGRLGKTESAAQCGACGFVSRTNYYYNYRIKDMKWAGRVARGREEQYMQGFGENN
jgi:hypothetical protein